MFLLEPLSVFLEGEAFLLALLKSRMYFHDRQGERVRDVAPLSRPLEVSPVFYAPSMIPQEGVVYLHPLDPYCRFRGKRNPAGFYLAADLLCVLHIRLPLLIDGDNLLRSFGCGVIPCVSLIQSLDEAVLYDCLL